MIVQAVTRALNDFAAGAPQADDITMIVAQEIVVLTDLVQIRTLGEKKRDENTPLPPHMKSHDHSDRILRRIAGRIEEQIDLHRRVQLLQGRQRAGLRARRRATRPYLRISPDRFLADYTVESEEEGRCPQARQEDRVRLPERKRMHGLRGRGRTVCQRFPHLVRGNWLDRQPHVGVRGPRLLLPDRLQLARSLQGRAGLQAVAAFRYRRRSCRR